MPCVVILQRVNKILVVPSGWVKNVNDADGRNHGKISNERVVVFFSRNKKQLAQFDLKPKTNFNGEQNACYFGHVLKIFGDCQQTESCCFSQNFS